MLANATSVSREGVNQYPTQSSNSGKKRRTGDALEISGLPPEIILKIFSFTSLFPPLSNEPPARTILPLVNRLWYVIHASAQGKEIISYLFDLKANLTKVLERKIDIFVTMMKMTNPVKEGDDLKFEAYKRRKLKSFNTSFNNFKEILPEIGEFAIPWAYPSLEEKKLAIEKMHQILFSCLPQLFKRDVDINQESDSNVYDLPGLFASNLHLMKILPGEKKNDSIFISSTIEWWILLNEKLYCTAKGYSTPLRHASQELRSDEEFLTPLIERMGGLFIDISEELQRNKNIFLLAADNDPFIIKHALHFTTDRDAALTCVRNAGELLELFPEFNNDDEIIQASLEVDTGAVPFFSPMKKDEEATVLSVLEKEKELADETTSYCSYEHISDRLKCSHSIIISILKWNIYIYPLIPSHVRKSSEVHEFWLFIKSIPDNKWLVEMELLERIAHQNDLLAVFNQEEKDSETSLTLREIQKRMGLKINYLEFEKVSDSDSEEIKKSDSEETKEPEISGVQDISMSSIQTTERDDWDTLD